MMGSNGHHPVNAFARLRWIWFGGSILSERENPFVSTHRLVIRELVARGQEVEYLEPADHPAFIEALKEDGSAFYRSFLAEFPDIRYRRYDMPRTHERDVWMSREAALVDVVVIESGAPQDVFTWIGRVQERTFACVLLADSTPADATHFDAVLAPDSEFGRYDLVSARADVEKQADRLLQIVSAVRARPVTQE
jgi:hypothetical protein